MFNSTNSFFSAFSACSVVNDYINLEAKGVIVASRYSRKKEFLAARSGAKGFITKDIPEPYLLKAIKVISAGEIWMTRVTVARVFEEYGRMVKGG